MLSLEEPIEVKKEIAAAKESNKWLKPWDLAEFIISITGQIVEKCFGVVVELKEINGDFFRGIYLWIIRLLNLMIRR